jgi:hypothetical protein
MDSMLQFFLALAIIVVAAKGSGPSSAGVCVPWTSQYTWRRFDPRRAHDESPPHIELLNVLVYEWFERVKEGTE